MILLLLFAYLVIGWAFIRFIFMSFEKQLEPDDQIMGSGTGAITAAWVFWPLLFLLLYFM